MFLDAVYNIFWLFTTSDSFVKDAESVEDVSKEENIEDLGDKKTPIEDYNVAGILGMKRKQ